MDQIKKYFSAEKRESILFLLFGVGSFSVGLYFLGLERFSFTIGLSIGLMVIALIQLVVGFTIFIRSPKDIIRVEEYLTKDKAKIQTVEIPRMLKVMKSFKMYKKIELFLVVGGVLLFVVLNVGTFLQGLGMGLFVQSFLMLIFDFFAERRGKKYLKYLNNLSI